MEAFLQDLMFCLIKSSRFIFQASSIIVVSSTFLPAYK
jgi:hypothetical protein